MKDQSVGSSLERLFIGYALTLAVNVMNLVGMAGTVGALLAIAGIVLITMALSQLRGCHPGYGSAFCYEVIRIVVTALSAVLIGVVAFLPVPAILGAIAVPLISVVSLALDCMVARCACLATADLVGDAGDLNTAALGATAGRTFLFCCAINVVGTVIRLLPLQQLLLNLLGLLSVLAVMVGLALVTYFLYRAKNSLN